MLTLCVSASALEFKEGDEAITAKEDHPRTWTYQNPDITIKVDHVIDLEIKKSYFVADIKIKDMSQFRVGYAGDDRLMRRLEYPYKTARRNLAPIAISTDFSSFTSDIGGKGIIIREGRIVRSVKNQDSIAFLDNGTMQIIRKSSPLKAQDLIDMGIKNVYSFGPTLLEYGVVELNLDKAPRAGENGRIAIGMIEPNHFLLILGNNLKMLYGTRGMDYKTLAELFKKYGAQNAFNLDGGRSVSMAFMGKDVNLNHVAKEQVHNRRMPDSIMFGTTTQAAMDFFNTAGGKGYWYPTS